MVKRKNVAIIPARGGSKRIPRKNIIDFYGKPMIAWTIEAAVQSQLFDRVIVSTDDEEIAQVSKEYGAEIPFMRDEHYDDFSTVSDVTVFVLEQIKEKLGEEYEHVVQLMANCPLRGKEELVSAYKNFEEANSDFQISCFKFGWMNPWWARKIDQQGKPTPMFPKEILTRSQDLDDLYCPTGATWIARVDALKKAGSFYGEGYTFYPMDWKAAVDIDDQDDLDMAKAVFTLQQQALAGT